MQKLRRPDPTATDVAILLLIGLAFACFVYAAIYEKGTAQEGPGDEIEDRGDIR